MVSFREAGETRGQGNEGGVQTTDPQGPNVRLIFFNRITFELKSYLQHLKTTCCTSTQQSCQQNMTIIKSEWNKGIIQGVCITCWQKSQNLINVKLMGKKQHFLNVLLKRVGRIRGTTDTVQSLPLTHFSDTFLHSTLEPLEAASCFVGILKLGLCEAVDQNWLSCWVAPVTVVPAWTIQLYSSKLLQNYVMRQEGMFPTSRRKTKTSIGTQEMNTHWIYASVNKSAVVCFLNLVSCSRKRWINVSLRNGNFNFLLHN